MHQTIHNLIRMDPPEAVLDPIVIILRMIPPGYNIDLLTDAFMTTVDLCEGRYLAVKVEPLGSHGRSSFTKISFNYNFQLQVFYSYKRGLMIEVFRDVFQTRSHKFVVDRRIGGLETHQRFIGLGTLAPNILFILFYFFGAKCSIQFNSFNKSKTKSSRLLGALFEVRVVLHFAPELLHAFHPTPSPFVGVGGQVHVNFKPKFGILLDYSKN